MVEGIGRVFFFWFVFLFIFVRFLSRRRSEESDTGILRMTLPYNKVIIYSLIVVEIYSFIDVCYIFLLP